MTTRSQSSQPFIPQLTSLASGSRRRVALAQREVTLTYSSAESCPACHSPYIFVAEAPVGDAIWLGSAVLAPALRPLGPGGRVAIFDPRQRLGKGAGPRVQTDVGSHAQHRAVLEELVSPKIIGFFGSLGQLEPARTRRAAGRYRQSIGSY